MRNAAEHDTTQLDGGDRVHRTRLTRITWLLVVTCWLPSYNRADEKATTEQRPLVYSVENSGADFPVPVLLGIDDLPVIKPLTDPFIWSDGSGRVTDFNEWSRRRAEIKAEIERYEIGTKPPRAEKITASYDNGTLTVNVSANGETLTLTAAVSLPEGNGPFPAIIGIGRATGSLPSDIFSGRTIATITFNFGQVMSHTQKRGNEPINRLYPELTHMGAYSAWSWGVSRLIDGLELTKKDLPLDLKHLGITGCSFLTFFAARSLRSHC